MSKETVDARIATLTADAALTLRRNPGSTILPSDGPAPSGVGRAFTLLQDLAGRRSAGLRIERTLGEGGMGIVHLAEQESMGRHVAVKTLKADRADPASATRLLREAWITGALEHPNIVPVYDVAVTEDGAPQVVLKLIDGVDWASLLASPSLLAARAEGDVEEWNIRTLMQVCNAVHFAHDRGVIHRDLKPENVMIGRFGEVYVVDWGIAVSLRADANPRLPQVAGATELAGTPLYMAPEMLSGDPSQLGVATDVYLLGAMLFELGAGRPPHDGPTLEAIFSQVLLSPPEIPSSVPTEIAAVCRRAMARAPVDRYASAADFQRALGDYLEHRESMRLARGAQRCLTELLEAIRDDEDDRDRDVQYLFGECRFGFRAALDAWAGNDVARGGLRLAIKSMAEHELGAGNLAAARLLVGELADAPEALRRGLAELERHRVVDAGHRARLEALDRDLDPGTGSRTRMVLAAVLGVVWMVVPVTVAVVRHATPTPRFSMLIAAGTLPVVLSLGYWARDSLMKTLVNRRLSVLLVFTLVAQIVLDLALILGHSEHHLGVALDFFLWFVAMGAACITIELRLWPTALGYGVSLFASIAQPELLLWLMAASQGVLTLNALWIWRRRPAGDGNDSGAPGGAPR